MAMLLAGCRTTREAAREEQASQTSETSLMSEDHSSSLDRFFSALSVNADSIVVWYADPSFPWEVESRVVSGLSPETATPMKNDSACKGTGWRWAAPAPPIAKVKIAGLQLDKSASGEHSATHQKADTLKKCSSASEQFSERLVKTPRTPTLLELLAAVGIAAIIAGAYYLYTKIRLKR